MIKILKISNCKKVIKFLFTITVSLIVILLLPTISYGQCVPTIYINGNVIEASGDATDASGLHLPYWLTTGQTLAIGQDVSAISVTAFTVSGNTLSFSSIINVTATSGSPVTVPANTVWKIESISKPFNLPSLISSPVVYNTAGTYTFQVPACVDYICIDAWGGGGGGGGMEYVNSNYYCGGGGGGGGYAYGCYNVTPSAYYTIVVGAGGTGGTAGVGGNPGGPGGAGGNTTIGTIGAITANGGAGGAGGAAAGPGSGGSGGTGGTSNGTNGTAGGVGVEIPGPGGNSGSGINVPGGLGGAPPTVPGGGGNGSVGGGTTGACGEVIIRW